MAETAVLNELLEEAANRSVALAEQAQEAAGIVDDLLERADSLAETLGTQAAEAHRRFQDLQARLEAADDELAASAGHARSSLEALPERTAAVQQRVEGLLGTIKDELAELKAKEDERVAALDRDTEAARGDLEQLAQQAQSLQDQAAARLQEAADEIATLRAAVEQARAEIQSGKADLSGAMDALEDSAREQVERYVNGMGTALTAHTRALFVLEHRLKDAHNDAVVALRQKFAEEVGARLAEAVGPLKESIEALGALCGDEEQAILQACAQNLVRFEVALQSTARSQSVLQAADRLS